MPSFRPIHLCKSHSSLHIYQGSIYWIPHFSFSPDYLSLKHFHFFQAKLLVTLLFQCFHMFIFDSLSGYVLPSSTICQVLTHLPSSDPFAKFCMLRALEMSTFIRGLFRISYSKHSNSLTPHWPTWQLIFITKLYSSENIQYTMCYIY